MKDPKIYKPVACDLVDQIEILATQKKQVELSYHTGKSIVTEKHILKTWETKNQEEFLITRSGLRVRLDKIQSIDGHTNEGACSIKQ